MIIPKKEVEKVAWESIKPTINVNNPEKSDGYNEWEVYTSFMNGVKFSEEHFYKYISDLIIENQGLKLYKDNESKRFKEISIEFARFIKNNPELVEDSILTVLGIDEYDDNYIAPKHFDNFEKLFDKFIKDKYEPNI